MTRADISWQENLQGPSSPIFRKNRKNTLFSSLLKIEWISEFLHRILSPNPLVWYVWPCSLLMHGGKTSWMKCMIKMVIGQLIAHKRGPMIINVWESRFCSLLKESFFLSNQQIKISSLIRLLSARALTRHTTTVSGKKANFVRSAQIWF